MNKVNKSSNLLADHAASEVPTIEKLATLSMPPELNTILASIDDVLADAMQHIDASLQQSSAQVAAARKRLLEQHSGLEQAYGRSDSVTTPTMSSCEAAQIHYQQPILQEASKQEQHTVTAMLEERQNSIHKAATTIEDTLASRQKAYESKIVTTNLHAQQTLQKNTTKNAQVSAEKAQRKEQAASEEDIKQITDQASNIHKQAADLLTSTGKDTSALIVSDAESASAPQAKTTTKEQK